MGKRSAPRLTANRTRRYYRRISLPGFLFEPPYRQEVSDENYDLRPAVYFACAISAGRQDALAYGEALSIMSCFSRVLTPEFAALDFVEDPSLSPSRINERDLDCLVRADALIAEITVPSLGVGYEISKAQSWGKPVLCLYRPGQIEASPMITGAKGVTSFRYHCASDLVDILEPFLATLVN